MNPGPKSEQAQIVHGIQALEAQRGVLGDVVVDHALAGLRARLAVLAPQALKQVSILFVDMVGSTALGRQLHPEDFSVVLGGTLRRCTALVESAGGRVLQYAGDNLLAVFGADESREDDAERAVHCGLACLAEGRRAGADVLARHGHAGFDVRAGIHTGGVLLGSSIDTAGAIFGIAVHIAARMEQAAPVGALRISHATFEQVRGVFDVQPQPPLDVKGVDEPMLTYLVQGVQPKAFRSAQRGIDGVHVPMVGRAAELGRLLAAYEALAEHRRPGAVTLVGEAGLGKSRLIDEFRTALAAQAQTQAQAPRWLLGRAQPGTLAQPYGLLRDLLGAWLHIADSDSAEVARRKVVEGLAPLFEGQPEPALKAQLLGHLVGVDFSASPLLAGLLNRGSELRDQAFAAGLSMLRRLAADAAAPLVLLLDDLHWADDGSLDFLQALLQADEPPPLLLLAAARPGLFERRPGWAAGEAPHPRIDLAPLGEDDCQALSAALLGRVAGAAETLQALRKLVTDDAEGNPFYMEELIKMLLDDGVIGAAAEGREVQAERLARARVPRTLTGVLQARLDALRPAERAALQQAALLGPVFWDEALDALQPGAALHLPVLLGRQLVVRRDGSAFEGAAEYAFHHHLLHQVAYETVLKAPRRAGHAAAAAWLVQRLGDRGGEMLAAAADHHERAGNDAQAIDCLQRASTAAHVRGAYTARLAHIARALDNPALTDPRKRFELLAARCAAADRLGLRDLQRVAAEECERLAEQLDDDQARADALMSRSLLADRLGDNPQAIALARQAWPLAERAGDASNASLALGQIAWAHYRFNENAQALQHTEQGLQWARRCDDRGARLLQMLLVMAQVAEQAGQPLRADEAMREARQLAQSEHCTQVERGMVLLVGSQLAFCAFDLPQIEACALGAVAHGRAHGDPKILAGGLGKLSVCALERGDAQAALRHAEAAREASRRCADAYGEAEDHLDIGRALLAMGQAAQAAQAFAAAESLFEACGVQANLQEAQAWRVRALQQAGEPAAALALAELVLKEPPAEGNELVVALSCHLVMRALGDARAPNLIEQAMAALQARLAAAPEEARRERLRGARLHREVLAAWEAARALA